MPSTLQKLYNIATDNGIEIYTCQTRRDGLSVNYDGTFSILLNPRIYKSERLEAKTLAEEVAHCVNGYMYPISAVATALHPLLVRTAERKARETAATLRVELTALKSYKGMTAQQIAAELDVEPETVETAFDYYSKKGLL